MENGRFIDTAKQLAEKLCELRPELADNSCALCVIAADEDNIFGAADGTGIINSEICVTAAEKNAVAQLLDSGAETAKQMVKLLLGNGSITAPSDESLDMLLKAGPQNENCLIWLSPEETDTVGSLRHISDGSDEFMMGFGDDEEPEENESEEESAAEAYVEAQSGEPASEEDIQTEADEAASEDCVEELRIDESNPFYEPPAEEKGEEQTDPAQLEYLYEHEQKEEPEKTAEDTEEKGKSEEKPAEAEQDLSKMDAKKRKELLKQAKKKKKFAKLNSAFKKKD